MSDLFVEIWERERSERIELPADRFGICHSTTELTPQISLVENRYFLYRIYDLVMGKEEQERELLITLDKLWYFHSPYAFHQSSQTDTSKIRASKGFLHMVGLPGESWIESSCDCECGKTHIVGKLSLRSSRIFSNRHYKEPRKSSGSNGSQYRPWFRNWSPNRLWMSPQFSCHVIFRPHP